MTKGWFVGKFTPTVLSTNDVEVAVKRYRNGDYEAPHYHKIATEITVIAAGRVRMNGTEYKTDDIIILSPGEVSDFECLEDHTVTVVVKHPGASHDKYLA